MFSVGCTFYQRFSLFLGYVFTAPDDMLDSRPGEEEIDKFEKIVSI
jgi:hypothetical protein